MDTMDIKKNCLDVFRIIACLGVFLGHFNWAFGYRVIPLVFSPVPVFFLLSGFLTAASLNKSNKDFFKKRFFRIYPELWLCVIINFIIILATYDGAVFSIKETIKYLVTQMTVCQFYSADWIRGYGFNGPNGALWTITVDIQFYILSFLFIKFVKNKKKTLTILFPITLLLSLYLGTLEMVVPEMVWKFIYVLIPSYLWIFILGCLFYEYKDSIIKVACKVKWISLIAFVAYYYSQNRLGLFNTVRYNAIEVLILAFIVFGFGFSYSFRIKKDYTYGFYLYHMVVINVIYQNFLQIITSNKEHIIVFIITTIITLLIAFISKIIANLMFKNAFKAISSEH